MADFGHLKQLDVTKDRTSEFTIHNITLNDKSPTLIVRPATEVNKGYFNSLLRRSTKNARRIASGNINAGLIEENRDEDRELYPEYVVVGWRDVTDSSGETVEFSKEECASFLAELPDWLFDDLRQYCGKPENFLSSPTLDGDTKGKN